MTDEARLEETPGGLVPATDGWFVVNVREASWVTSPVLGDACVFESERGAWPQVGFTIGVLQPGQSGGRYHGESNQEDFLVLAGRVPAADREPGAAPEGMGLRALPAVDGARRSSAPATGRARSS